MVKRRSSKRKCCRRYVIGKGKFWDGVKGFLKKTKILSTAASLIPGVGPALGNVVSNVGYGRKRRHSRRSRRGGATKWSEIIKKYGNKSGNKLLHIKSGGPSSCLRKEGISTGGRRRRRSRYRRRSNSTKNLDNRYIDNKDRVL